LIDRLPPANRLTVRRLLLERLRREPLFYAGMTLGRSGCREPILQLVVAMCLIAFDRITPSHVDV
jgi:hypothetical protein